MSAELTATHAGLGYASRPITKPPEWHALVALDTLFNGLSTGLFLVAALAELTMPSIFAPAARLAYPFAFAFLLADLICLVLDLGDPLRFHHMLRVFKPTSPMSLGVWSMVVYSLPLLVVVILELVPGPSTVLSWTHRLFLVVGLLPAMAVALYKGVLFSTTAQPGWKDSRWLGGYFANSAFVLGCAGMLVLSLATGPERAFALLRLALIVLLVLNGILLVLMVGELRSNLSLPSVRRSLGQVAISSVLGGIGVPLLLLLVTGNSIATGIAVALVLAASAHVRFAIVRLPHLLAAPVVAS